MSNEAREVTITIRGKNLTSAEFDKARKELAGVDDQAKQTSLGLTTVGNAFKAIGAAVSIGAIGAAINEYADFTGELTDMSAKTGIGVEALQRLKYAAEQNGGSLEQVSGAITKLSGNLAGGNESAVGALKALGLSFDQVRSMAPDKAFTSIGDAIAKIPDPMAQSKLAMDLFGKSGAELLPMMKGGLSETADAADRLGIVLSEEAVAAGDAFGDTMGTLGQIGKSVIAQVLEPMIPVLTTVAQWLGEKLPVAVRFISDSLTVGLGRAFLDAKLWMNEFVLGVAEGVNKIPLLGEKIGFSAETIEGLRSNVSDAKGALAIFTEETIRSSSSNDRASKTIATLNLNYGDNEKAVAKAAAAAEKARLESTIWGDGLSDFDHLMADHNITIGDYSTRAYTAEDATAAVWEQFYRLRGEVVRIKPAIDDSFGALPFLLQDMQTALDPLVFTIGDRLRAALTGLGELIRNVPGTLARAFEGGGDWMGAAKSIGSQFGSTMGESIGRTFSSLGSLGGPIGAALGGLLGPLVGKLGDLFSNKNTQEVRAYNVEIGKVFATLQETHGGLDALEAKAQTVGLSFRDNLGHQGKAGLEAVNNLAQEFTRRWDEVNESLATSRSELDGLIKQGADLGYVFDQNGKLVGVSTEKMREVAQKFGLDLKALGPSFDQAELRTRIGEVINGFELMDKGGATTGTILAGMKDEINAIVNDSIRFKTDIPANMQPWIENLIDAGALTDENGEKIKDLAGIKFGAPVQTEFDKISKSISDLIASIQTLVDRIGGIASAAATIPKVPAPWADWGEAPTFDRGAGDWGGGGNGAPGFARGTFGTTGIDFPDFGSGTHAVLHNREAVVPYEDRFSTALRWLGAAPAAPGTAAVNLYLAIDPNSGRVRRLGEADRQQIQQWHSAGDITQPRQFVTPR